MYMQIIKYFLNKVENINVILFGKFAKSNKLTISYVFTNLYKSERSNINFDFFLRIKKTCT